VCRPDDRRSHEFVAADVRRLVGTEGRLRDTRAHKGWIVRSSRLVGNMRKCSKRMLAPDLSALRHQPRSSTGYGLTRGVPSINAAADP